MQLANTTSILHSVVPYQLKLNKLQSPTLHIDSEKEGASETLTLWTSVKGSLDSREWLRIRFPNSVPGLFPHTSRRVSRIPLPTLHRGPGIHWDTSETSPRREGLKLSQGRPSGLHRPASLNAGRSFPRTSCLQQGALPNLSLASGTKTGWAWEGRSRGGRSV